MAHERYGQFKTGKDQRVVVLDVKVGSTMKLGELVKYTAGTNTIASAGSSTNNTFALALDEATHMIALTDKTVGGIPGEVFPGSIQEAAKLTATDFNGVVATPGDDTKRVGLYPLFDKSDIVERTYQ